MHIPVKVVFFRLILFYLRNSSVYQTAVVAVEFMYPLLKQTGTPLCHFGLLAKLNEVMAEKFPGLRVAEAQDTIDDADEEGCDPGSGYSPDQLSSRTPSGCPPHTLRLAVGMPIMATANMPGVGVYNGTQLIITSIVEHRDTGGICFLGCAYVDADGCVCEVDIHHHAAPTNDAAMSFLWTQRQFPVMLCFGMTIKCVSLLLLFCVCCGSAADSVWFDVVA